jgi:hypothetical protein
MQDYVALFEAEDQQRVFRFLALFARWECALKRNQFARAGAHGQAEADWNAFADRVAGALGTIQVDGYADARDYLQNNPPQRQYLENGGIAWRPNPRRADETDARYLFRVVRDVRNNLFHGGKYQGGPVEELARDRRLIDSATHILEAAVELDARVRGVFEERPNKRM